MTVTTRREAERVFAVAWLMIKGRATGLEIKKSGQQIETFDDLADAGVVDKAPRFWKRKLTGHVYTLID